MFLLDLTGILQLTNLAEFRDTAFLTFTFVEYSTGEGDRGKGRAKNILDEKNNNLEP